MAQHPGTRGRRRKTVPDLTDDGREVPSQAPLAEDVDVPTLARAFKVSGGNIANIALAAAFLAAEEGTAIAMPLILRAARREFQKIGRVWDDAASRPGS